MYGVFRATPLNIYQCGNTCTKIPIEEITLAAWVKTGVRGMIASWDRSEFSSVFAVGDDVGANAGTTFVAFDTLLWDP